MSVLNNISYHAVYDRSIMDALKYAKDNGFAGIQVAVELPHLSFEGISAIERQEIKRFISDYNFNISLHTPDNLSFLESSKYLRQGILNYCKALFDFAEEINAKIVTFHTGSMTTFPTHTTNEERTPKIDIPLYGDIFQESLDRIIRIAGDKIIICIENYKLTDMMMEILQPYLNDGKISLCWDIPKTYDSKMCKLEKVEGYFINNIKHIKQVHLHDINNQGRSHHVIGTGAIDFKYFFSILVNAYVLDYCIEVRPREKAKESLDNLKRLIKTEANICQ